MGKIGFAGGKVGMEAPSTGIALADIAEGSIVYLNESGNPVPFYVAKHDYESGLNGTGRTLLVRKDAYVKKRWDETATYKYATSTIDSYLNSTYKAILDSAVQSAISTTKFYIGVQSSEGGYTTNISRAVFALSLYEFNLTATNVIKCGSPLPIATLLKIAYYNGSAVSQWTRSVHYKESQRAAGGIEADGTAEYWDMYNTASAYYRPCFTLPATAVFDEETLEFKEVA